MIEKSMVPIEGMKGKVPTIPKEWVEAMMAWARDARAEGRVIKITALVNLINNKERREQWIEEYRSRQERAERKAEARPAAKETYTSNITKGNTDALEKPDAYTSF